jgi:Epoxide hydrolase N terminus
MRSDVFDTDHETSECCFCGLLTNSGNLKREGEAQMNELTSGVTRRRFLGVAAAGIAAGPFGVLGFEGKPNGMTISNEISQQRVGDKTAIRPFPQLNVPEAELTDLRRRIQATRWPDRETVSDASQGIQLATVHALAQILGGTVQLEKD